MGRFHRFRTMLSRQRHSKGFGIHSPFAFDFVKNVLCEQLPYYAYDYLDEVRQAIEGTLQAQHEHQAVLSASDARTLFRIVNRFEPMHMLQVGVGSGLPTVSMMSPSGKSHLSLYEPAIEQKRVAVQAIEQFLDYIDCYNDMQVAAREYLESLADGEQPFVLVNEVPGDAASEQALFELLRGVLEDSGVIVIPHTARSDRQLALWQMCRAHAVHGHSYTNEDMVVIVSTPKLPLQHFALAF